MKYAFWNNKGGVGKTFLCFATASEYAVLHPKTKVVVIDMCPQANISEILLGGNGNGGKVLQRLLEKRPVAQTIGGYYHERILRPHNPTGTEMDFLVRVRDSNPHAPPNLYLVAGDSSLELQVQTINTIAVLTIPDAAWRNVHEWVADLQQAATTQFGECAFFVDCNPSFSAYTEQAILAAERLIAPCTPDSSSARAIRNVGQLVYGHGVLPTYRTASFSARAKAFSMSLPKIHLVAMNRSTVYRQRPAAAFEKMFENIREAAREQAGAMPEAFSRPGSDDMFLDIPDVHTVAIVALHSGTPIGGLRPGEYDLDGVQTQINSESLDRYRGAIRGLAAAL